MRFSLHFLSIISLGTSASRSPSSRARSVSHTKTLAGHNNSLPQPARSPSEAAAADRNRRSFSVCGKLRESIPNKIGSLRARARTPAILSRDAALDSRGGPV